MPTDSKVAFTAEMSAPKALSPQAIHVPSKSFARKAALVLQTACRFGMCFFVSFVGFLGRKNGTSFFRSEVFWFIFWKSFLVGFFLGGKKVRPLWDFCLEIILAGKEASVGFLVNHMEF